MNKKNVSTSESKVKTAHEKRTKEIKYQESPIERALKLSSDEAIARAIKDLIDRDSLN